MKNIVFRVSYSLFIGILLCSCVTARKVNYMQEPSMSIPSYKDSISFEEYRLKPDDRLYIRIYSLDERMNDLFNVGFDGSYSNLQNTNSPSIDLYTYIIDNEGNITLPVIEKINLEGKTIREAKDLLEKKLQPDFYLNNLDIDIRIVGRYYSIIGQSSSGRFPLSKDKINIFQALAQAGDIGTYGNRSKIRILRETENGTQIKEFDVRSADIINSEFYYVEPNDVIYIQNMTEQIFGITHVTNLIGLTLTTFSFGLFLYSLFTMN